MKILNKKVLIVIILFFSFLIFNKSNCFATYEFDDGHIAPDNSLLKKYVYFVNPSDYGVKYYYCFTSDEKFTVTFESKTKLKFNHKVLWLVYGPEYKSYTKFGGSDYFTDNTSISSGTFITKYSSVVIYDSSGAIIYEPEKDIQKVTPTLYIDDQNLKKRFKFQFEIPLEKEDTKYYVFLQKYTRNSYDSVTATFTIYTVSTPEGYDATNYENYMYYDLPSKGLYLPAGTVVKWYNCTINNGSLATLNLFKDFVPAREKAVIRDIDVVEAYLSSEYFSKAIEEKNDYLTLLVPTKINVEDFNPIEKIREFFFNTEFSTSTSSTKFKIPIGDLLEFLGFSNLRDFHYFKILSWFYYADPNYLFLPFDDLAFSNFSIVSYENSRISNSWTSPFYNIYRKTKVYDQENKIDDSTFVFNYSDGQDVSSLLPADMNKDYLTSPFFKDNENSTSKGNITYDINEIIQGDKIIDYSKEDNSIHNNFNSDYIENFKEGDNITINNYYTETIEKTSDSHLLHNIYIEILEIKTLIASMDDFVSNETNNFTYNTENNIKYYLIPSKVYIKQNLSEINSTAKKNLGIIYEPVEFLIYTVTLFSKIDSTDDIVLNIPDIEYKNTYLLHSTTINFTSQMQNLPILGTMHNIYLTCVDFVILGLLIAYAIKVSKEVFNK